LLVLVNGSATLLAVQAQAVVLPVIHVWPTDPPPCDAGSTLQACIDSANGGDAVQIATNGPVMESISIAKSLTLSAASGFTPLFSAGNSIKAETSSTGSNSITIAGLTLGDGVIHVVQNSSDPLTAHVVKNTIATLLSVSPAIAVDGAGSGAVTFEVSRNTITLASDSSSEGGISILPSASSANGQIASNTIVLAEPSSSAIVLGNYAGSLSGDVIGNRISGTTYTEGIFAFSSPNESATVRILDNLVSGQTGSLDSGAIVTGGTGTLDASVVNNTVVGNNIGIAMNATPSATLTGLVANNIASGNTEAGIAINSAFAASVPNRSNLIFGNGSNSFTPGSGTITLDPLYVGPNDYHLQPGSPAIDAGDDGSVPADLITDLDGNPRIQGAHVDIGAYETAPEPAGLLGGTVSVSVLGALAWSHSSTRMRRAAR